MQHSPPPLFKQGASSKVKVLFFSIFSVSLLIVDTRLQALTQVRQTMGTMLYPLQQVALAPKNIYNKVHNYFTESSSLQLELDALRKQQILNAEKIQKSELLAVENVQLRHLANLKEKTHTPSVLAEILYDARDEFARKIVLNKGSQDGVAISQPVVDDKGVVGQITRVFPMTSEVTLITDKNYAIPVQIERTGLRSVVNGRGRSAYLDLRVTANADVKEGDILVTSGIDGVYPMGLQVARVALLDNKANTTYDVLLCKPVAGVDHHQHFLILLVDTKNLPQPESEDNSNKKDKINRRVTRDAALSEMPPAAPAGALGAKVDEKKNNERGAP